MLVVLDTDVLIPCVLKASRSAHLLRRLEQAGHRVATSPAILAEVQNTMRTKAGLRRWLDMPDREIEAFLHTMPDICAVVPGVVVVEGVARDDPSDDKILAAALECDTSYIVSEDRHLRKLVRWKGIPILNRIALQRQLDRLGFP